MRRHHAVLLALTGFLVCQPRAATAEPNKGLIPTLLVPLVEKAPILSVDSKQTVSGWPDPLWNTLPTLVVDATLKDSVLPVTLAACRTADAWFIRWTWPDPTGKAKAEGQEALVVRWLDALTADGETVPRDARPGDVGSDAQTGLWADGRWTYELKRVCRAQKPDSVEPPGALEFSVTLGVPGRRVAPLPVRLRPAGAMDRRDFQADAPGATAKKGFRSALAGKGKPPSWLVRFDAGEAGNRSLVQEAQDEENDRFPLALLDGATAKDVDVSVRFQARKGFKDRGAGVVFRVKDEKNHYILRANMLEGNVVLYKMQDGLRIDLPAVGHEADYGVSVDADPEAWHTLRATAVGDRFQAYFDGRLLFDVVDTTFPDAGGVGLWTKSDSVMAFDDLVVVSLDPAK